jgi:hypothetical protein
MTLFGAGIGTTTLETKPYSPLREPKVVFLLLWTRTLENSSLFEASRIAALRVWWDFVRVSKPRLARTSWLSTARNCFRALSPPLAHDRLGYGLLQLFRCELA